MRLDAARAVAEVIWHFTCDSCRNWWSIGASDAWLPQKLFCPHCAHFHEYSHAKEQTHE